MRDFIVSSKSAGKKVIRAAILEFPNLTPSSLQKALKHKDIRINGKRISSDIPVSEGDRVELWLPEVLFEKKSDNEVSAQSSGIGKAASGSSPMDDYKVVFESDDLLLVNKRQGLAVHGGKGMDGDCLIDILRRDYHNPSLDLCHRIDMNTGGLILTAKNKQSLEDAIALFKADLITKRYRCLVRGVPTVGEHVICQDEAIMKEISAYLEKPRTGNVFIHDIPKEGDLPITSRYRVLHTYKGIGPDGEDVSDIEVELVTGRTHQIRAQFAHLGHPILGDGNYGRNQYNLNFRNLRGGKVRYQQLFASTLLFGKIPKENIHSRLSGRHFAIEPLYDVKLS
ncbi:MAG: RluA family pseudouridine synthase [Clostridiales bacterium]|nr:RluA family pseudouridine synthase [Clostridiales bacterium]